MAVRTKDELKSFFETGKKPTQSQFEDLIDTSVGDETFVPYTGANDNVVLGAYSLSATNITVAGSVLASVDNSKDIGASAGNYFRNIYAYSFIKKNGVSTEFLKADGSVDTNTYLTTANAASTYVPYTGASTNVNLNSRYLHNVSQIGIGITTPTRTLDVFNSTSGRTAAYIDSVISSASSLSRALTTILDITPTSDLGTQGASATFLSYRGTSSVTEATSGVYAELITAGNYATAGTLARLTGSNVALLNDSTGTITSMIGYQVLSPSKTGGAGTISNFAGVLINDCTVATNVYALSLNISSGSNKYNIYGSGTAQNYLAGNLGIGQTTPSAYLHLKAGTATAGTAPIKLTPGTNLTTPETGTFEFDGTNLYFTIGGVRKTVTVV